MSDGNRAALVRCRLEQAEEALAAARLLADSGMARQAVGRAYYAAFYSVLALLASRGMGVSKHAGAIGLFDREFVKTGGLGRDLSKDLHELFDLRQRADYRERFTVSAESAQAAIAAANRFLLAAHSHLAHSLDNA